MIWLTNKVFFLKMLLGWEDEGLTNKKSFEENLIFNVSKVMLLKWTKGTKHGEESFLSMRNVFNVHIEWDSQT